MNCPTKNNYHNFVDSLRMFFRWSNIHRLFYRMLIIHIIHIQLNEYAKDSEAFHIRLLQPL